MTAAVPRWTSDHRDDLLTRVGWLTAGTAAIGVAGALGIGVALAAEPTHKAAARTSSTPRTTTPQQPQGSSLAQAPVQGPPSQPASSQGGSSSSQLAVRVLNGSGIEGVAHSVADQLRGQGYDVVDIGNTSRVNASVILFRSADLALARRLAGDTGVVQGMRDDTASVVTLVLGPDWQGAGSGAGSSAGSGSGGGVVQAPQQVPQQPQQQGNGGGPVTSSGGS
jgi:hypothetical protein